MAEQEKGAKSEATPAAPSGVAAAALKRSTEIAETLRHRGDLTAKALAAGGSALVTAVGIAKFSDLFPWPPEDAEAGWVPNFIPFVSDAPPAVDVAVVCVIGGFLLLAVAVGGIAYRYWNVNRLIPIQSDVARIKLKNREKNLVLDLFKQMADLNDVTSLQAYESRAHRYERIAKWLPADEATSVRAQAEVIQTEVLVTHARAKVRIIRERLERSVRGPGARLLYVLFGVGVLAFGVGADYLASERTDKVAVAKACAEARGLDGFVEGTLPKICGDEPPTDSDDPTTTAEQIAAAANSLGGALATCLASESADVECEPIRDAILLLLGT
jgi:hypothetical protein